jgi:hypothetical protein
MSEFSESYHLKNGNLDDVVALIRRSGQTGYAAKVCDGWTTAIPESTICGFSYDENFVKGNTGILLHYNYPEDHGFSFTLF